MFRDGQAQIVSGFEDAASWIRHDLWVETEFDSDGDGRPDRMHVDVTRPAQTDSEGLEVPVVYESSPYYSGTGSPARQFFWDIRQEVGAEPPDRNEMPAITYQSRRPTISSSHVAEWVPRGFAVVHSESPGTGLSQGCPTVGGMNESLAPKAVIDWLNGRARGYTSPDGDEEVGAEWSTGKVGMTGTSYNGTLPLAAATTGVEGLEAIIPIAPNTSYYHYYRSNGLVRSPGGWPGEDIDVLYDFINSGDPARRGYCDSTVRDGEMADGQDRVTGDYNDFWAGRDYLNAIDGVRAATLIAHAFNDWNVMAEHSLRIYAAVKARGVPAQVYYHQGSHGGPPPFERMNRWFTRYLYGVENGVEDDPRAWIVREDAEPSDPTPYADFPNPEATPVRLHPQAGGAGVGTLLPEPRAGQGSESVVDDVSFDGASLAQAESSPNRLLYATPELLQPVHISGLPSVTVRIASNRAAANLSVWLVSLPWTEGAPLTDNLITRGWADPQNHSSLTDGEPLIPGHFYDVTFPLQPDDQVIPAGQRIGLMIFSSDRDFTLWPEPGTELTIDLDATSIEIPVVGGVLLAPTPSVGQETPAQRVQRILSEVPLIDGHNDLPGKIREIKTSEGDVGLYDLRSRTEGDTDLPRLRQGMVGAQFWSVHVDVEHPRPAMQQLEQIDIAHRIIAAYPDELEFAGSASDIERVFGSGKIASLLGIEGGHVIENSLGALRAFYRAGVRYMGLTHFSNTDWADSATDSAVVDGLSPFGEEVVREMNRMGMLVDLAHVSPATMSDALDVAEAPVIFSHAGARALADHPRNVPDSILTRLRENGGVLMQLFYPPYLDVSENPTVTISVVADHIEHIRDVAGIDHVGIGSDFDGIPTYVSGLEDVSTYPALFMELARRGWSDADLRKLAGENLLRVLREAESMARRLQRERPPSTKTIEELDGGVAASGDIFDRVEHHYADSDGVRIHYVTSGEGPLVVMIHGFPDFWYTWRDQMEALEGSYRVAALDMRGYNRSDRPEGVESYAMPLLMQDVEAVIRDQGAERAIVVGHDWGGAVAWSLAMYRPDLVDRLIVLNLPHPQGMTRELANNPEQERNSQYARNFQQPGSHEALTAEGLAGWVGDETARARYVDAMELSDFEAMMAYYKANYPRPPYQESPGPVVKTTMPVLQIHGLDDTYLLAAGLSETWEWLDADLTLVTIPGAAHFVQQDASELVTRSIIAWLGR